MKNTQEWSKVKFNDDLEDFRVISFSDDVDIWNSPGINKSLFMP